MRIKGINRLKIDKQRLYNLAVEGDESYIVNGVVVHNCRSIWTPITKKEAVENNVEVNGAPENLPTFGSKTVFKDVATNADFALNEGLATLKNLGITDNLEGVSIKNGVVIGSNNKYNLILEKITQTLTGQEQVHALQALADILPDTDPLAATMKKFLNSVYNVTAKNDGIIESKLTKYEERLLRTNNIKINRVSDLKEDVVGQQYGNTIDIKGNTPANVLHHEIGHVIDSQFEREGGTPVSGDTSFLDLIFKPGGGLTLEADQIVRHRFANTDLYSDENWQKLKRGLPVPSTNHPDQFSKLNQNQRYYFFEDNTEIFAEAYSQYVTSPSIFSLYAPNLKDFFDILLLN